MYHIVRVPKKLSLRSITVDRIEVQTGERVRRGQTLAYLQGSKQQIAPIVAPGDGWVKRVAVKEQAHVKRSDVLFIIDSMTTDDYQVDPDEVNPATELGEDGRRSIVRKGHRKFGSFVALLVNAAEVNQGNGQHLSAGVKPHPEMQNMKEGVPLKTSAKASVNQKAIDSARNDPALQKQMNPQLQKQLAVQSAPSSAPTLKA